MNLPKKDVDILALAAHGLTGEEIANRLGVSERTIKNRFYKICDALDATNRTHAVVIAISTSLIDIEKDIAKLPKRERKFSPHIEIKLSVMQNSAHSRSKRYGVEKKFERDDLRKLYTDTCPVLNIKLSWSNSKLMDNSPSLDRIDNTKGYVNGNMCIMSQRANRIKSDGTAIEHKLIAKWMTDQIDKNNKD